MNSRAYTGWHWRHDDVLVLAFNEGGMPPLTANLWLRRGWIPIGFYIAVGWGNKWFRFHRIPKPAPVDDTLLLDERITDWSKAFPWDESVHGKLP
jgi:hypothetical protein